MMEGKDVNEILKAIEVILLIGKKVFEDKKINASDLVHLAALVENFDVFKKAIEGFDTQVKLSPEEFQLVGANIIAMIGKLK